MSRYICSNCCSELPTFTFKGCNLDQNQSKCQTGIVLLDPLNKLYLNQDQDKFNPSTSAYQFTPRYHSPVSRATYTSNEDANPDLFWVVWFVFEHWKDKIQHRMCVVLCKRASCWFMKVLLSFWHLTGIVLGYHLLVRWLLDAVTRLTARLNIYRVCLHVSLDLAPIMHSYKNNERIILQSSNSNGIILCVKQ